MTEEEFQPQRSRSPAYPYLNLGEVVEHAKNFYRKYGKSKVPTKVALPFLGYSAVSGSGVRVIASLTQFEIFDIEGIKEDRKLWLTDVGRMIVFEHPTKPDETRRLLQEAALKPEMHRWMYDNYGLSENPLSDDNTLWEYELVAGMGFSEKAAAAFVKEFRETYEYAQLDTLIGTQESAIQTAAPNVDNTANFDGFFDNIFGRSKPAVTSQPTQPTQTPPPVNTETRELTMSLTRGKLVKLVLPKVMNQGDYEILVSWLDMLKKGDFYEESNDIQSGEKPNG